MSDSALEALLAGRRIRNISVQIPGSWCADDARVRRRRTYAKAAHVRSSRPVMEAEKNFRKVRIGANLRRLRLDAKLSQRQVADYLTEKSPSGAVVLREHVSVWEQGNKEPLGGTVERLADLFQCDPGEFYRPLNGTGTPAD